MLNMFQDETQNLQDLHQTLADASELMAAFVGCAKGSEQPPELMIEVASKTRLELAEWRLLIKSVCEMVAAGKRY